MTRLERVGPAPGIAVELAGVGPPLIFLHGIGGNRSNWHDQLAFFASTFTAAAWDARGYGDSDDPSGTIQIQDFADDLARVFDKFGWVSAHVVGLSLGATIALEFDARHPGRCRSLALVSAAPRLAGSLSPDERAAFLEARRAPLRAGRTPADIAPMLARSLVSTNAVPGAIARLEASITALRTEPYLKTIEASTDYRPGFDLARLSKPVLIVNGACDTLTPPRMGRALASEIPNACYEEVPGAGHLVNIEASDAFNALVTDFLNNGDLW